MIKVRKSLEDKNVTFVDLFCGTGAWSTALESFGANCVFANDINFNAVIAYRNNHTAEVTEDDIRNVNAADIPGHDILCGSFPCQKYSIANRGKATSVDLFPEMVRIAAFHKPKVVLMENVANILNYLEPDGTPTIDRIVNEFTNIGYDVSYQIMDALDYGVPQKRPRVFIVCFRKDLGVKNFVFPKKVPLQKHLTDLLEPSNSNTIALEKLHPDIAYDTSKIRTADKPVRVGSYGSGISQGTRIYSEMGTAITLTHNSGGFFSKTGGYLIKDKDTGLYIVRKLTGRECCRLTGFDDSYIIPDSNSRCWALFGNAVVVDVVQYLMESVIATGIF